MKSGLFFAAAFMSAAAFAAMPQIKSGSLSVVQQGTALTVSYELENEDAIVTCSLLMNGEPLAASSLKDFSGDINRALTTGSHTFTARFGSGMRSVGSGQVEVMVKAWSLSVPPDYVVFNLDSSDPYADTRFYESADLIPGGVGDAKYKTDFLVMRKCHAAGTTFLQGLTDHYNSGYQIARMYAHPVSFSRDYYMAIYEFTQGQIENRWTRPRSCASRGSTDWKLKPYTNVHWQELRGTENGALWPDSDSGEVDSGSFIHTLRGVTGIGSMDLPTEAQWEFACRAGTWENFYDGYNNHNDYLTNAASSNSLVSIGWCSLEVNAPQPVGGKLPNAWGFYDMSGNVSELCLDWFTFSPYSDGDRAGQPSFSVGLHEVDPRGPAKQDVVDYQPKCTRVIRGCGYNSSFANSQVAKDMASIYKSSAYPDNSAFDYIGFRVCCGADMSRLGN